MAIAAALVLALSLVTGACGTTGTATSDAVLTHGELLPGELVAADLNGDGVPERVEIDPQDRSLIITDAGGSLLYQSRDKWHIMQAVLGDTDHDGLTEVVTLLCSEKGRHLGLFAYFGGTYRERFVTQAICPIPSAIEVIAAEDAGTDGAGTDGSEGDLVVLIQPPAEEGGDPQRTLLRWNGFGYTRVETSPGTE